MEHGGGEPPGPPGRSAAPDPRPVWADLAGLPASCAVARAEGLGFAVRTVTTSPPWPGEAGGCARVVRIRADGPGRLELTVAPESFRRRSRPDA